MGKDKIPLRLAIFQAMRMGAIAQSPLFSIRKTTTDDPRLLGRVVVVVSKNTAKRAVDRNKIKRRMRELVRNITGARSKQYLWIVSVKKNIAPTGFELIKHEANTLLHSLIKQ